MTNSFIIYHTGIPLITYKTKIPIHHPTLGAAKIAAKNHIKSKNTKLTKDRKLHFDEFVIKEFELVEKTTHPL